MYARYKKSHFGHHTLLPSALLRAKTAHISAEDLILPAAIDVCTEIVGESAANKLQTVPLSNDTVRRRIQDMSEDKTRQTSECIGANGHYALQLDESTDVANRAILMGLCQTRLG
jgi:hypothetical protein